MNRYEYNKKILKVVEDYVEKYHRLRFIQILWALNIVNNDDRFYEEPDVTLQKVLVELNKDQSHE